MSTTFSTIEEAVEAIRRGRVIVVVDAEDRENEGDFVCAAEKVTPATINFMITHGRGQLCMPILPDVSRRLELAPMVESNTAPLGTNYTVPVDHRTSRTGITAGERARTILALCDPTSKPTDFTRPGHLFPLVAKEGGVLRRAGHTEAAVDLARMAGLTPAGALCEILDEQGDRANRTGLLKLAREFDLPIISIEQLIAYRRQREKLVFRQAEALLPTKYGNGRIIAYGVKYEAQEPLVYVIGDPTSVAAPLVRLHSSCFTGDLMESLRCDCGDQLHMALDMIGREGVGVLVYLPQEGRGIGLVEKIKAYALQDQGMDTVEANIALGYMADPRDYGVGIQLLKDLGLRKVRLLTNNPKKTEAFVFGGFDLEVVDQVPIVPPITEHNAAYLATKREKWGTGCRSSLAPQIAMHYRFHVNLFARPEQTAGGAPLHLRGIQLTSLRSPDGQPPTFDAYFPVTFDDALGALAKLPRLDAEPDGFFILAGGQGPTHSRASGHLFDFDGRLHRVELHGDCPAESFDALLRCFDWPHTPLAFELVREGVALDERGFRAWAAASGNA